MPQSNAGPRAGGNVEVRGNVCGAMVEATNITVRTGIQGMNRGVLRARELVVAKFIENATVYADQEIIVSNVIFHVASASAAMRDHLFCSRLIFCAGNGLLLSKYYNSC